MPTFGSLFAGIGGIDLGLERAGWECRFQVEWDDYCQRVLAKHWPDVPRYGDIRSVDWSAVDPVDLVCGGFPCQPISKAGRRRAQDDERWLWPEFARAIRELRPTFALVENVSNLLAVNDGAVLGEILGDLASLGYDAEWDCLPAAAVGAPHLRDRFWLVAHRKDDAPRPDTDRVGPHRAGEHQWPAQLRDEQGGEPGSLGVRAAGAELTRSLADSDDRRSRDTVRPGRDAAGYGGPDWIGRWWAAEPDVGRVAHGVPARVDRLRALGNAVVPQVVEVIGRRLLERAA